MERATANEEASDSESGIGSGEASDSESSRILCFRSSSEGRFNTASGIIALFKILIKASPKCSILFSSIFHFKFNRLNR